MYSRVTTLSPLLCYEGNHCNYVICPDTFGWFYLCLYQLQVFIEKPIQAHIAEIDISLLEAPSDKDESSYLGSGMFGSCQKMFYEVHR